MLKNLSLKGGQNGEKRNGTMLDSVRYNFSLIPAYSLTFFAKLQMTLERTDIVEYELC